ncbi:filamentous hemagglutinin N-terminal domain-containing protein [Aerosakkonemataceae cyanobacterium BLCC-F50]|uniref:Filamentous hemagglutinin N-terminal domain-containing protein n=1 Tax=Floridaenema flaviceps BLCC-F50 TaxID=3153642 RepID=A0ABV4XXQ5_9CYAN
MKLPLCVFCFINSSILFFLDSSIPTAAQIIPDATLPVNSSVRQQGNTNVIEGGTTAGTNLFHSFESFSIPTGGTAFFNNASNIQNIFSRVTGRSISNIDGIIKANGTANLFLLNPNGIIFGLNARLNIGGSFLATTANSINFADSFQFSATNPQTSSLLTINVPIGLQFGQHPASIQVQGTGYDLSDPHPIFSYITRGDNLTGLQVLLGRTLALVGGDINSVGGVLMAEQGRIELGSVDGGEVRLNLTPQGFTFDYQGVQNFRDIRLSQRSLADASGGGFIQIQANNLSLNDASLIWIQNQESQQGGVININAAQSIKLSGINPPSRAQSVSVLAETIGSGNGADIAVSTKELVISDGQSIITESFGSGKAGNVNVSADSIQLIGFSPTSPINISVLTSIAYDSGNAGNVTVSTQRLTAVDGGEVASVTFGSGNSGDVTVNATDIELIGASSFPLLSLPSGFATDSLGAGNGSILTVNTSRLVIRNGGITSSAFATGDAGDIRINATEFVEIGSLGAEQPWNNYIGASARMHPYPQTLRQPAVPSGFSGNVTINTPVLRVGDNATVQVDNQGVGNGGTLRVQANYIFLNNGGKITAATTSGTGGNIQLQARNLLLMRRNSSISATASSAGDGGNININTPLLVAFPTENSDISANSIDRRGGNVTINSSAIFGTQFRSRNTSLSDITAFGRDSSLNGNVQINTPDIDPSAGLIELPVNIIDSTRLIAQGCAANRGNSFIVTGRGGLPPLPNEPLRPNNTISVDWVGNTQEQRSREIQTQRMISPITNYPLPTTQKSSEIVEATGWVRNNKGQVILISSTPSVTTNGISFIRPLCP